MEQPPQYATQEICWTSERLVKARKENPKKELDTHGAIPDTSLADRHDRDNPRVQSIVEER